MIKNVKNVLLIAVMGFTTAWTSVASAGGTYVTVKIETIAIVSAAVGGHKAGNMELKIKDGFSPSGVSCSHDYLTTLKTADADRAMLSLLRDAYNSGRDVTLGITDDSKYTAYSGRCSVLSVVQ
ncbi:MAG: hypothetical protein PHN45_10370 [Methylococcales bacterium]|nr:hypothetical protein [Methylococcales bacterium]MDD5755141.1 hypothetical protein [Methylococcales bacterium]